MRPKPIPIRNAISFDKEIHTANSPIKVVVDDYSMYLAKHSRNKNPATDIINELLAYYFLQQWGIPAPSAALININPKHLLPEYSNNHKQLYYKKPVFGSKWIDAIEISEVTSIESRVDYRRYNDPEIIFTIGLFDIWVENDDRKPTNTNLLLQTINGYRNIIPIDHCYIFSSLNYNDLNPKLFSPSSNENIFLSRLAKSLKSFKKGQKGWKATDMKNFYIYVENCKKNYAQIVKQVPDTWGFTADHKDKLYDFLFNEDRNKLVFEEYAYKMR